MGCATVLVGCAGSPATAERVVAVSAVTAQQAQPALGPLGRAAITRAAESERGSFTLLVAGAPEQGASIDLVARRERGSAGPAEVEYGPRRAELLAALEARAIGAVGSASASAGAPDLLRALAEGARGEPGTLLVADSGISVTDPLDLRVLGFEGDPVRIAQDLRARDLLPDLSGWHVLFSGLGRVAADQPPPGIAQQRWLERLWLEICRTAGAAECTVDPVPEPARPPTPGTRVAPVVPVPVSRTVELPGGAVEFTLPDSRLGFGPGSAELGPGADAELAVVVERYRAGGYRLRVEGFVAYWGDEAYRNGLSQERAFAVGSRLVGLGVAAADVVAVGLGAADGPEASQTGGRFDEAKVVANGIRRVVVRLESNR